MLTLRVTALDGRAPAQPIEARFDAAGGTIGRADGNRLVLPDPGRHISRLHARVAFDGKVFELIDQGGNPIDVNGAPLGQGKAAALRHGDKIRIGGYVISVALAAPAGVVAPAAPSRATAVDDAFAGLFGAGSAPAGAASAADPLGLGLGAPAPAMPLAAHSPPPAPRAAAAPIDPFADFGAAPTPAPPAHAFLPDDLDLGLGGPGGAAPRMDDVFGLGPATGEDPFAGGPLAAPSAAPNAPAQRSLDPLADWNAAPLAPVAAPVPDHVPDIHTPFKPPAARTAPPPATLPPAPPPAGGDIFLSWEDSQTPRLPPEEIATTMPIVHREPPPAPPPRAAAPAPVAAPAAGAAATAGDDELTRAFIAGLGVANLPLATLTPEAMERIGRLLREATQGTLDLLVARALTKREVRAEVTMIVGKDNNPLKFSPSVEAALAHLLAPTTRGFMPPVEAMHDAYDDLRAHQFGFMAGLRAALAGVLRRFDPAVLEQRLVRKSMLDSVLPMNRRAKLWDLYEQLYREVASEAEDDFHTLFGREFLRAYEEQVDRLDARGPAGGAPPG